MLICVWLISPIETTGSWSSLSFMGLAQQAAAQVFLSVDIDFACFAISLSSPLFFLTLSLDLEARGDQAISVI